MNFIGSIVSKFTVSTKFQADTVSTPYIVDLAVVDNKLRAKIIKTFQIFSLISDGYRLVDTIKRLLFTEFSEWGAPYRD